MSIMCPQGIVVHAIAASMAVACAATPAMANGEQLYGVHWWDYSHPSVGDGTNGGWAAETIITHSGAAWWEAPWFQPLFAEIHNNRGASIVTRVDYNWGETIPNPSSPHYNTWKNDVVNVANTLGAYSTRWVIGNEPNLTVEANNWPNQHITPQQYAQTYVNVRNAIKAVRPNDEVLVAPVSPGGIIPNIRWKDGNQYLSETISAIKSISPGAGGDIDGFAIHAYGNPFTGGDGALNDFANTYKNQLNIIDAAGFEDTSAYITEWSRGTSTSGNLAANEAVTAEFIRDAFKDVHTWNTTPGNHNIMGMMWFVYNKDYGGWDDQSLEWWRNAGNPHGHPGDLWTAYLESGAYPAGVKGLKPISEGFVPEPGSGLLVLICACTLTMRRRTMCE